jgi:hypothetical protein
VQTINKVFKAFCWFFRVVTFVFCTSAVRADFSSPAKNISNSSSPSLCPKIVGAPGSPNVYVIWIENVNALIDHLCFTKSTDHGVTWATPVQLTSQGQIKSVYYQYAFSLCVDEPYVHIVFNWRADATDDWEIRYCRSNDCGETWPVWTQLTNNDTSSLYPDVAARGSYVHVTYQDDWAGNFEVMYKRITNYGAGAVDQTRRLTSSAADTYFPPDCDLVIGVECQHRLLGLFRGLL